MRFTIKKPQDNLLNLVRKLGYRPWSKAEQEFSCIRQLSSNDYPRFHLYIKDNKEREELTFNLHLDQKRPFYPGNPAHSGEYEGKVVEKEIARLKQIVEG